MALVVRHLINPDAESARLLCIELDPVEEGVRGKATRPAEAEAADRAQHVWATSILFDYGLALGAVACFHAHEALLPLGDAFVELARACLLYTSPSPRDRG